MKENKYYYNDGTTSSEYDKLKVLHRADGPAVEWVNGDKEWWTDGHRHRVKGPAVEYADGLKAWHVGGKPHRTDGPAVEYPDGAESWWVDGEYYSEEDLNGIIEEVRQLPLALRLIDPREWVRNYGR